MPETTETRPISGMKRQRQFSGSDSGGSFSYLIHLSCKLNDGVGNSDDTDEHLQVKSIHYSRNRKRQSEEVFQAVALQASKNNFILTEKHPDIVISIGGDGMLLSASSFTSMNTHWIGCDLLASIPTLRNLQIT